MDQQQRSYLAGGVILVLIGVLLLALQTVPELKRMLDIDNAWPLIVVGIGVALLVFGLVIGVPSMAIPATIVGGIGGILLWQSTTGHWSSWAYMWTLIPGFVGLGMMLSGVLGGAGFSIAVRSGLGLITTSLVLFTVFGTFFGAFIFQEPFWPILLIALGVLFVGLSWFRSR